MRSDSVKNMSAYADQNHAPSLTDVRLELDRSYNKIHVTYMITPTIAAAANVIGRTF
jgi:hypothetical protein